MSCLFRGLIHVVSVALIATAMLSAQHAAEPAKPQPAESHQPPGATSAADHPTDPHAVAAVKEGEGHAKAPMANEIWWKWANFAILAGVLGWLMKKNLSPFLRERSASIQHGIVEATQMRKEAEERASAIEARIGNLQTEVAAMRQRSSDEMRAEGERVRAETEQQIAKVRAQSEAEIAAAAKNASLELKAHSARLALELAERQIQQRMTPQTQEQLTGAFLQDLRKVDR